MTLKAMVLQAVLGAPRAREEGAAGAGETLALAEPGGFHSPSDEAGDAPRRGRGRRPPTLPRIRAQLMAAFAAETPPGAGHLRPRRAPRAAPVEPLSQRELEVLQLIAQGLSNRDISERLFLALDTVKGHNQKIFGKLQVQAALTGGPCPRTGGPVITSSLSAPNNPRATPQTTL